MTDHIAPLEDPIQDDPDWQTPAGDESPAVAEAAPEEAQASRVLVVLDEPGPGRVRPRIKRADALFALLLAIVLGVAGWLRFDAQNWDDYTHLHPDERFLTDVVSSIGRTLNFTDSTVEQQERHRERCEQRYPARVISEGEDQIMIPAGHGPYFDADCSPLNPNNIGKGLYVYGEFPLFTVHAAGVARSQLSADVHAFLQAFDEEAAQRHTITTHWEGYSGAQLVGRTISALADWLTVIVLLLLGRQLYGRWSGLLAAALYAVAAFPIQQAHFWTVDAFTTFWVTLALYLAARAMDGASVRRGPVPLVYLAVWAVGAGWETGAREYPVLGLATLGICAALALAATVIARRVLAARGRAWGDLLVAASGVLASAAYLAIWTVLIVAAPREFALGDDLIALGFASAIFALAVLVTFVAAGVVRRQSMGLPVAWSQSLAVGSVGIMWMALVVGLLAGGLSSRPTLFVAAAAIALLILDVTELTDYALFGVALGGAVASRINVAPLAGIIVVAAAIRALPALDRALPRVQRNRLVAYALTGVMAAAVMSFVVFRLLQPHAFLGPGLFGLQFNPGWRDDVSEAAHLTSGNWDAPPNHQWANRTPYLFPWRNIVLWGLGIPLGVVSWAAWAWAGLSMIRARREWTRHAIPFLWVLVCFGWLGGRWVTTMRYFLPIYPALALFAAWALIRLVGAAWRGWQARPAAAQRLALAGAVGLLIVVLGYTTVYGFAFHNIHRQQLTRVAASRWFQETVPGDFGIWVEADGGTRKLVNIGRGYVANPPAIAHLEQGESVAFDSLPGAVDPATQQPYPFTLGGDAQLTAIVLHRVGDPAQDPEPETVRVRLFRDDPALGRQMVFEDAVTADFSESESPYGRSVTFEPGDEVILPQTVPSGGEAARYVLEITAVEGGPVMFTHNIVEGETTILFDVSVGLRMVADGSNVTIDFTLPEQPFLLGYGDDIPATPTHWTVGGRDEIPFAIPIDGTIRTIEIPHLGDVLRDADEETIRLSVVGPDGQVASASITDDFNRDADPLGQPRLVELDPPLEVRRLDASGSRQMATLVVEALDPVYTSGPVVAWEGDWDDPVPWPVCAIPDDVIYRDDLPSGLSSWDCAAVSVYGGYYQGIKLWMSLEDNQQKRDAMINALDQADYLVITSNRFYDSLSRMPMRWPMTLAYYDALFDGRLGYELVKVFESPPSLGPITIRDQALPTDDLPGWVNEHWEAEEAFHVYDHPAVLVFAKTDAYSHDNTAAILDSVSIRPVSAANAGYVVDPEPVGVVPWGAKQASEAPTLIEFPDDKWATQREGGTWSRLFDLDALVNRSEVAAVIAWWALIVIAGWLAWPLLFVAFPALPDRAYPLAKTAAWLIVAWIAWVGGTLGGASWSRTGIAIILLALAALSGLLLWRRRADWWLNVRRGWRYMLALEGLAALLFAFFLWVRLGNPDLWHNAFGGEKPMDFAYFNAVLRSTIFPPIDPWYAGGYMNYYYFGYVIVGAPVKLLGIQPSVAYNLIIPALYAMTGTAVFSIAYNWVAARRDGVDVVPRPGRRDEFLPAPETAEPAADGDTQPVAIAAELLAPVVRGEPRAPKGNPWLAGLAALVLAMVLGNLGTVHVIVTNVAAMPGENGAPRYTKPLLFSQVRQQEIEPRRTEIYDRFYAEAVEEFRDEHGYAPTDLETFELVREAQERTDAYIEGYINHPPLVRLWEYELGNLRRQVSAFVAGLGDVLGGKQLPMATHRWYWAPTRILAELPNNAGGGAILEMPYFTFLYGDLHAHMIAMPVTLLALAWLLAEILGAGRRLRTWWEAGLALGIGALAVGLLRPTNSWDWITYLLLGAAGLTYVAWLGAVRAPGERRASPLADRLWDLLRPSRAREWWVLVGVIPLAVAARIAFYLLQQMQADQQARRGLRLGEELIDPSLTAGSIVLWVLGALALVGMIYVALLIALRAGIDRRLLVDWTGRVVLFVGLTFVVALPFTAYFATAYNSVKPWEGQATPLWVYLYVHGLFLFIAVSFLVWQSARWLRYTAVRQLQGLAVPVLVVLGGMAIVLAGSIVYGVREVPAAQVAVPLIAWAALLFFLPRQNALLRVVYALIVLALAITIGVEVVVLDGDIGRQNTVFKFYLQVWFLLSVVGGVALAWMLRTAGQWKVGVRIAWQTGLMILVAAALLYPLLATQARFLDRFNKDETPRTLDGMAYMKHAIHGEHGVWFSLESDYHLIRWLQDNVEGTPVVMEAHLYPSEYHWGGRISIYTGLPTMLGWTFHQRQQHTLPNMDVLVQTRENNSAAFYALDGEAGIEAALGLIRHYDIGYIVVGILERVFYDDIELNPDTGKLSAGHAAGLAKFETMVERGLLEVVYEAPVCLDTSAGDIEACPAESVYMDRVYRVVPGAAAEAASARADG